MKVPIGGSGGCGTLGREDASARPRVHLKSVPEPCQEIGTFSSGGHQLRRRVALAPGNYNAAGASSAPVFHPAGFMSKAAPRSPGRFCFAPGGRGDTINPPQRRGNRAHLTLAPLVLAAQPINRPTLIDLDARKLDGREVLARFTADTPGEGAGTVTLVGPAKDDGAE